MAKSKYGKTGGLLNYSIKVELKTNRSGNRMMCIWKKGLFGDYSLCKCIKTDAARKFRQGGAKALYNKYCC